MPFFRRSLHIGLWLSLVERCVRDSDGGTHEGQARDELSIVDEIEYTGLIPGNEYTANGILMDKSTGEAALDDEGQTVSIPAEETPGKGYPKTGAFADVDPIAASVLVIALCGAAGAYYTYIRRSCKQIAAVQATEAEVLQTSDED